MSGHTGIAVLESGWGRKKNVSVRGLFDLIANIACENPNAYHYEMANSEGAAKEAIPRIATYTECRYLYIASHGDYDGLHLLNGEKITRTEIRNMLVDINRTPRSKLHGLHLGSCLFTTDQLASYLFEKDVGLTWIAGYYEEVDWIDSSAFDLLFFNELLSSFGETELSSIKRTAEALREKAEGLVEGLGFGIFVRRRGGGLLNLCERTSDAD